MPKAWQVEELTAETPLPHAAALILGVKLPEVLHYEREARGGKVAGIHDMRIASKRLREAVRVLRPALPEQYRKRLLKRVEALNDALGLVRDRDVLGQALQDYMKRDPRASVLTGLLDQFGAERRHYLKALNKYLKKLHQSGFERYYSRAMEEMAAAPAEGHPTAGQFVCQAVGERLEEVVANLEAARQPWDPATFHRERIRVKKLKYALEPFLTILPGEVGSLYKQIAELQELMGQVHDYDVQAGVLRGWEQQAGSSPGISVVQDMVAAARRQMACQMRNHLAAMEAGDFAMKLMGLIGCLNGMRA